MTPGPVLNGRASAMHAPIADDLARVEEILAGALGHYRSAVSPVVGHLSHYRGKRLRPAMLLLVARACGGVVPAHHILAAAIEMIHTATLVHDDVLDEAEVRRHADTVNRLWGNKVSILLGDLLFTRAFYLTSTVGDALACELIGAATNRVCAGEMLQTCERGNLHLDEATYFEIVDGKTAALTECAARLGAIYAGADAETCDRMAEYGRAVGIAFQIADDLLDLAGDERLVGKTLGTDLAQGKLTLPLIRLMETASPDEAEAYRAAIREGSSAERAALTDALIECGGLAYARAKADQFARSAARQLDGLPPSDAREILETIPTWTVRRAR